MIYGITEIDLRFRFIIFGMTEFSIINAFRLCIDICTIVAEINLLFVSMSVIPLFQKCFNVS